MWAQRPFLHEHHKFTFTKLYNFDVDAKFVLKRQPLIGVNALSHELLTQQEHVASHFDILILYKLQD